MKLWIKLSSENRKMGAWFFDLDYAKECAKSFERLIPVELPGWMSNELPDDADHKDGEFCCQDFPSLVDEAYRKGRNEAIESHQELLKRCKDFLEDYGVYVLSNTSSELPDSTMLELAIQKVENPTQASISPTVSTLSRPR